MAAIYVTDPRTGRRTLRPRTPAPARASTTSSARKKVARVLPKSTRISSGKKSSSGAIGKLTGKASGSGRSALDIARDLLQPSTPATSSVGKKKTSPLLGRSSSSSAARISTQLQPIETGSAGAASDIVSYFQRPSTATLTQSTAITPTTPQSTLIGTVSSTYAAQLAAQQQQQAYSYGAAAGGSAGGAAGGQGTAQQQAQQKEEEKSDEEESDEEDIFNEEGEEGEEGEEDEEGEEGESEEPEGEEESAEDEEQQEAVEGYSLGQPPRTTGAAIGRAAVFVGVGMLLGYALFGR
jgi:hypothetical protein